MKVTQFSDKELKKLTDVMKAMAHPMRLKILCHLKNGEKNVTELQELLEKGQAMVSQQLRILRLNDLVTTQRKDGHVYYRLPMEKQEYLKQIVGGLFGCLDGS